MNYLNERITLIFVVLLFQLFLAHISNAQISNRLFLDSNHFSRIGDSIFVNKSYEASFGTPLKINKGDIIFNRCENLYLINSLRYQFYEKIRFLVNDSLNVLSRDMVSSCEEMLLNYKEGYNKLLQNCDSTTTILSYLLDQADSSLKITSNSLAISNQSLDYVKQSLKEANILLENEKSSQIWQKMSIGLAGIGLGILIAIIVQ